MGASVHFWSFERRSPSADNSLGLRVSSCYWRSSDSQAPLSLRISNSVLQTLALPLGYAAPTNCGRRLITHSTREGQHGRGVVTRPRPSRSRSPGRRSLRARVPSSGYGLRPRRPPAPSERGCRNAASKNPCSFSGGAGAPHRVCTPGHPPRNAEKRIRRCAPTPVPTSRTRSARPAASSRTSPSPALRRIGAQRSR